MSTARLATPSTLAALALAVLASVAWSQSNPVPPGQVAPLEPREEPVDPSRLYTNPEDIPAPRPHYRSPHRVSGSQPQPDAGNGGVAQKPASSKPSKNKVVAQPAVTPKSTPQAEAKTEDPTGSTAQAPATKPGTEPESPPETPPVVAKDNGQPKEAAPPDDAGAAPTETPGEAVAGAVRYSHRLAAVIGISRYTNFPPLEGAAEDAARIGTRLKKAGFDVTELYDTAATRKAILNLLGTEIPKKSGEDDLVLIYFAGHGQTETLPNSEKRGYIVPVDGEVNDVFSSSISMEQLRDVSNRIPAKHIYYAMDSCYSGMGFLRSVGPMTTDGGVLTTASQRAIQMITAGTEGQQARERGGIGLFTSYLLRALDGAADADGNHVLTAREVGVYVQQQVEQASESHQTPQYGTIDGTGEITFVVR